MIENSKPTNDERRHMARVHHNLGVVFYRTEQPELARKHWEAQREISSALVRSNPFDPQFLEDVASSAQSMAVLNLDAERFANAETYFRQAQEHYAKLLRQFPDSPPYRSEFARSTHGLARAQKEQGKLSDARQVLERGAKLFEELSGAYPEMVAYRIDLLRTRRRDWAAEFSGQ